MQEIPLIVSDLIVLAGGFGTRLKSIVKKVPKPMADINGKPFLEYLLHYWIKIGIRNFHILNGYKGDIIEAYFGDKFKNANIKYYREYEPLGTGGALKNFFIKNDDLPSNIGLINGDTWLEIDFNKLLIDLKNIKKIKSPFTIVGLEVAKNDRYSTIITDRYKIKQFSEPKNQKSLINAGFYLIETNFLKRKLFLESSSTFSLENQTIPDLLKENKLTYSQSIIEFVDIGLPEDFIDFKQKIINNKLLS